MDTPPWHYRTKIHLTGEDDPVTTLLDAVRTYSELAIGAREHARVEVIEPHHEEQLSPETLDQLLAVLPDPV